MRERANSHDRFRQRRPSDSGEDLSKGSGRDSGANPRDTFEYLDVMFHDVHRLLTIDYTWTLSFAWPRDLTLTMQYHLACSLGLGMLQSFFYVGSRVYQQHRANESREIRRRRVHVARAGRLPAFVLLPLRRALRAATRHLPLAPWPAAVVPLQEQQGARDDVAGQLGVRDGLE